MNHYQQRTGTRKLHGQYFTPAALVERILAELPLTPAHRVLDPACGDGRFLAGVVAALRDRFPDTGGQVLARHWAPRLLGADVDPEAVAAARANVAAAFQECLGVTVAGDALPIRVLDALEVPQHANIWAALGVQAAPGEPLLIVGNPPYVEAKRLPAERKRALKRRFPHATRGAPDLYVYFLHAALGWLRDGDHLAFVLPNKAMVNRNARQVREQLLAGDQLRGLWLASRLRLFGAAGVYPIVLFAGDAAGSPGIPVRTATVTGDVDDALRVEEHPSVTATDFRRTTSRAFFVPPAGATLHAALEKLLASLDAGRLGDVLDLRWSVSFHRAGLREQFVTPDRPDSPHARPFLGGGGFSGNGEVCRYTLRWNGWWIRFDPAALAAQGSPPPAEETFAPPKVVLCQNSRTLRAALDEQGYVLKDTFLCGRLRGRWAAAGGGEGSATMPAGGAGRDAAAGSIAQGEEGPLVDARGSGGLGYVRGEGPLADARGSGTGGASLREPLADARGSAGGCVAAERTGAGAGARGSGAWTHPLVEHPRALVGLLCSRAVHFFFSHVFHGGHVSSGYLHFLSGFAEDIPIGAWTGERAAATAALVQRRESAETAQWEALEAEIEAHVTAALGLTPAEAAAIEAWAAADQNWVARERVPSRPPAGLAGRSTAAMRPVSGE